MQAAISGISAIIDAHGHVLERTRLFDRTIVTATVTTTRGETPYVRFGEWVIVACIIGVALASASAAINRPQRGPTRRLRAGGGDRMTTNSERQSLPDPLALAVELAVYAPIGVAAYALEVGPDVVRTVVARGRAEVEVRQEQVAGRVRHAKGAGQVAIAFGLPLLRRKVGQRLASLRPEPPAPAPAKPAPAARAATPTRPPTAAPWRSDPGGLVQRASRRPDRRRCRGRCGPRRKRECRVRGPARDSRLRRALGVAGRRTARGTERRRARRGPPVREPATGGGAPSWARSNSSPPDVASDESS